jgi:hypothetical protein
MAVDWMALGGFTVKAMAYKNINYVAPTLFGGVTGSGGFPWAGGTGMGPADPAWNETNYWVQMRGDIFIIARASADLQGVFGIEVNSTRFGEETSATSMTGGYAGKWNTDAIAVQVKAMYIDFKVPEIPVRFKVGMIPFQLRNPVFLYADAAGVQGNLKIAAGDYVFNINPFWAKMYNGTKAYTMGTYATDYTTADDGNFFGVDLNAVLGDVKPGMFFAMQKQSQLYNATTPYGTGQGSRDLWWLGAYADAKFGPVDITADFIYNGGYDYWKAGTISVNYGDFANPAYYTHGSTYSIRHEAWLARGVASYTVNKFKFGLGGLYGTGDNAGTLDKNEGFMVPYRSEAGKFNDDFLVLTGDWGYREPYGTQNTGGLFRTWSTPGQGVWYVRGFADFAVTDWLKLKINTGYIGDTARHADEFGTDANDDQYVGWEMDAAVQINIYKNLYFDNAFGYLIGGKAMASQQGGWRAQDPWAFVSCLTYVF